jgi:periplasmic protein TonB
LDQVIATLPRDTRLPWRISRRGRSRISRIALISLWLHLSLLLFAILTVHYEHPEEQWLPPPAEVAMVFEGGRPEGPTAPNPQPYITPAPQPAPAPSPPAPAPAPQAATVPPPPTPTPQAEAPPLPTPPVPTPPPQPQIAMSIPRPPPLPPAPRPEAVRPPVQRPAPFPAPMNFSFGGPMSHPAAPAPRSRNTLDFSLAPRSGPTDNSPFARVAGAQVGPDWRNLLSKWVRDHAYYPQQAAMNGEDGTAKVRVEANPDGHVTSVELRTRSGSMWLDMALQSLFRDAHLPPLHEDEPITFDFTMHYILIRGP